MGFLGAFIKQAKPPTPGEGGEGLDALKEAQRMLEEGMALEKEGQLDAALQYYERAIHLQPDLARAYFNRGNILLDRGDAASAIESYEKAIEYKPDSAGTHYNMGSAHLILDNAQAAIAAFRQAITLKPDFVDAHYQLGTALLDIGKFDDAISSYRQALAIDSGLEAVHTNLGSALKELHRFDDAIASYTDALQINPLLPAAHNNLGLAYCETMRFSEAVESYRRAIRISPDFADAYSNLGGAFKELGRLDESIKTLEQAIVIDPGCLAAHSNLLFIHNYVADQSAERMLTDARRFGEMAASLARPFTDWVNSPDPSRTLRVGFVSGDLCDHSVGHFLESLLNALRTQLSSKLELTAYLTRIRNDEMSKRLRACFKYWHSAVGLSDVTLAKRIRDDRVDILIDLSGHTAHNRLTVFAWRPAPVQVSWLGYCATTGVAEIDYYIADETTLPVAQEDQFVETIWRLPGSYVCLSPPTPEIPVKSSPAAATGKITFGSFNNLTKMGDQTIDLWARVLHAVPDSKLFLKSSQLADDDVVNATIRKYSERGIGSSRLILGGRVNDRIGHLSAYNQVDIALDPFPYNGVTTTAEALWMGVPVLTLAGERFLSRQGVGLLTNAGLADWIASDPDDYVARAVAHASDLQRLADLRSGLRRQVLASPLFDAHRFAENFEIALRGMWHKWCAVAARAQRYS